MADDPAKVPAPPSRWLRIALVLSLTVNLLLIGLAVGAAYNFRAAGGPPRSYDMSLGPMGRALDGEARRELGRALSRMEGARPPRREDRARVVAELAGVLRADPFDPGAFSALLDRQRAEWAGVQDNAQRALVAYLAAMSPEERAALADRLQEMAGRREDDGRDDD